MKRVPFSNDLYVISDSVAVLKKAVEDGAAIVQLRDKSGNASLILAKAREMVEFRRARSFVFVLNDDPALAVEAGADGVHIGQDMDTPHARSIVGSGMILGKTTHNVEQARQAMKDGADYISVGPVYATPTKPGRPAVGLEYVREAAAGLDIPFVAIGGIDLSNIDDVLACGAKTIGVVRACADAPALLARIRPGAGAGRKEGCGRRKEGRVRVSVGGKTMEMKEGTSLREFMESHGLGAKQTIAVLNEKVVKSDLWPETVLSEGDCLELVSLVGGG